MYLSILQCEYTVEEGRSAEPMQPNRMIITMRVSAPVFLHDSATTKALSPFTHLPKVPTSSQRRQEVTERGLPR